MDTYTWIGPLVLVEGPAATVTAGSMVGAGLARFWPVWVIVVLADVAGDSLLYLAGRWSRHPRVSSLLARIGFTSRRAAGVTRSLPRLVMTAKLVDVLAMPAFVAAGVARIPYRRFAAWVTAGSAVRAAVLLGAGALLGTRLTGLLELPGGFLLLTAAVAGPVLLVHLLLNRLFRRLTTIRETKTPCASSSAPTPTPRTSTALPTSPSVSPPR
ncbi:MULTISPECIES: DedA family protein [Catenuloplanes]|uniref:Membrane protein DedA with SNARE-associated domain n=1 Tax=Catenuloplanes niger TaxID=587534 RepID=A0AAE4CNS2_9ACTN|nr:VTT domain-containing protein [Catenuloplanes niger]MDR7319781.1 membrane protein DedA with SNARE-associated domain [Catenuloplanes niger]